MELLVERDNGLFAGFLSFAGTFVSRLGSLTSASLVDALKSDASIELGNLMRILARSRYLDRASPVKVEMAECECQVFDVGLSNLRVVHSNIEVSW